MKISQKNAELAMRQVGLDRPGPMRKDMRDALIVQAGRLAEFLDRMDHMMEIDPAAIAKG